MLEKCSSNDHVSIYRVAVMQIVTSLIPICSRNNNCINNNSSI